MKTHPPADAAKVTEAFVAVASGAHAKSKREPGLAQPRQAPPPHRPARHFPAPTPGDE